MRERPGDQKSATTAVMEQTLPKQRWLLIGLGVLMIGGLPNHVNASPAVDGVRNLSLANASRGSSTGSSAVFINPAGLSFTQQFSIEPVYQLDVSSNTHGIGLSISDSLNNPHVGLALSYVFMKGAPKIAYEHTSGQMQDLKLSHYGHEASLVLSIAAIKNWLYLGIRPKYQYSSLRYYDDDKKGQQVAPRLNAFGLDASVALDILGFVRLTAVGYNLTGKLHPWWTEEQPVRLENVGMQPDGIIDHKSLSRLSDYPLALSHGISIFPLRKPEFNLNFDGLYDFSSYKQDKFVRNRFGGSAEFIVGRFPLRAGGAWDGRGRGKTDDRSYLSGGTGYIHPAQIGGLGVDIGVGVSQQIHGPKPWETVIGINIGMRMHPNL